MVMKNWIILAVTLLAGGGSYDSYASVELLSAAITDDQLAQSVFLHATPDGRFVVFQSRSHSVVEGQVDTRGDDATEDLFLYDRDLDEVRLVTHAGDQVTAASGSPGGQSALWAHVSQDGSRVVFSSTKTNLVDGFDSLGNGQIYSYDVQRQVNTPLTVSALDPTVGADGGSTKPQNVGITGDTIFLSNAQDLLEGFESLNPNRFPLFLHSHTSGDIELLTHVVGEPLIGVPIIQRFEVSLDGSTVVFVEATAALVPDEDVNCLIYPRLFALDIPLRQIEQISRPNAGLPTCSDGYASFGSISADGRRIAFSSSATNLLAGLENPTEAVFFHDRDEHFTYLVSGLAGSATVATELPSFSAQISPDGQKVAYSRSLVMPLEGFEYFYGDPELYLADLATGSTALVTHMHDDPNTPAGTHGNRPIHHLFTPDGSTIFYESSSRDLVGGLPISALLQPPERVYAYDIQTNINKLVTTADGSVESSAPLPSRVNGISGDDAVYFSTSSTNLATPVASSEGSVFAARDPSLSIAPVSPARGELSRTPDGQSRRRCTTYDGRHAVIATVANNIMAGYSPGTSRTVTSELSGDLFVIDRATGQVALINHIGDGVTSGDLSERECASADDASRIFFTDLRFGSRDSTGQPASGLNDFSPYLYDRASGEVSAVFRDALDVLPDRSQRVRQIATDSSGALLLYIPDDVGFVDGLRQTVHRSAVLLYDTASRKHKLINRSYANHNQTANGYSYSPRLSPDGTKVVFFSRATDVIEGFVPTSPDLPDVYLFDLVTDELTLVSRTWNNSSAGTGVELGLLEVADDGTVLFASFSEELIDDFRRVDEGVNLYVFKDGVVQLVNHDYRLPNLATSGDTFLPAVLTRDASAVFFQERAVSLVENFVDSNADGFDIYRYDLATGVNTLISHAVGQPTKGGNATSVAPAASADGSRVTFLSAASDLIENQENALGTMNAFAYDLPARTAFLLSAVPGSRTLASNGNASNPGISDDGEIVFYDSEASDLVENDSNGVIDVFAFELANLGPQVDAGPMQSVALGAEVLLAGEATYISPPETSRDLVVEWTKLDGPGDVSFADAEASATTALFNATGTYVLRLLANDGIQSGSSEVTIVVTAPQFDVLTVDASDLDFGSIATDTTSSTRNVSITSQVPVRIELEAAELSGPGADAYSVAEDCPFIDASETCVVVLEFLPSAVGQAQATLQIRPKDASLTGPAVLLNGTGVAGATNPSSGSSGSGGGGAIGLFVAGLGLVALRRRSKFSKFAIVVPHF